MYKLLHAVIFKLSEKIVLMAYVEVIEDPYVEETTSHPEIYKRCRRQNDVVEKVWVFIATLQYNNHSYHNCIMPYSEGQYRQLCN